MIASDPHQGGATWAVLQYLLGLRRLGHDIILIEPLKSASLRPASSPLAESDNAAYFREVVERFGLDSCSALLLEGTQQTAGLTYEYLLERAFHADVLINVSGMLVDPELTAHIPIRVYLDLDPAFVQLWHTQGIDMRFAGHTHFATVGLRIGMPSCSIPTCERDWITTLQPVVLEEWPAAANIVHNGLTTIANWRGYGSIQHEGVMYGQKVHSFRQLMKLPTLTHERFLPALAIHPGETRDIEALVANGWNFLDPGAVASTPDDYRRFVQGSKAEIGVAKSGYVVSRCGWFSDRSACYLASGRPVIAQDTGFGCAIPTGEGLFSFSTAEDVLAAIDAIASNYDCHSQAARQLALEYFDSDRVLTRLLMRLGANP